MSDAAAVTVDEAAAASDRRNRWVQILVGVIVGTDLPTLINLDFFFERRPLFAGFTALLVIYGLLTWRFGWQTPVRWWAMIIISVVHIGARSLEVQQLLSIEVGRWSKFNISLLLGDIATILPALGVISLLLKMPGRPMARPRLVPVIDERVLSVIDEPY